MTTLLTGFVDPHTHFRQGSLMQVVAPISMSYSSAVLPMGNINPPPVTGYDALVYRDEIAETATTDREHDCYIIPSVKIVQDVTTPETIEDAVRKGVRHGKIYPMHPPEDAGVREEVTTGSETGVYDFKGIIDLFAAAHEFGMIMSVHGETPGAFVLEAELRFAREQFVWIAQMFPNLKLIYEHISRWQTFEMVADLPKNVAGTITAHHPLLTLDDVAGGRLHPHNFCKPLAGTPADRSGAMNAAFSGNPKFFFGSDTAPHEKGAKECADGCAGIFTALSAPQLLMQLFESEFGNTNDAKRRLQGFACDFARDFYELPSSKKELVLERKPSVIPDELKYDGGTVIPFWAGKQLNWSIAA